MLIIQNFSYVFMEFKTPEEAAYAINAMHGHPFDARHTFYVNYFTDVEKYAELDVTFVEPEQEPYQPKVCSDSSAFDPYSDCNYVNRSTCVLGLQILKAVTSMQPIEATMLRYTGMENLPNLKSRLKNGFVSARSDCSFLSSDGSLFFLRLTDNAFRIGQTFMCHGHHKARCSQLYTAKAFDCGEATRGHLFRSSLTRLSN